MPNVKVIIAFAAVAAVLSLFAGIIGGVAFGVILLRMILGAAVFGALGAGISLLVDRFMPELFSAEQQGATAEEEEEAPQQGSQVDIVLDNEEAETPDYSSFAAGAGTDEEERGEDEDRFIEEVHRSGEEAPGTSAPEAPAGSSEPGAETAESGAESETGELGSLEEVPESEPAAASRGSESTAGAGTAGGGGPSDESEESERSSGGGEQSDDTHIGGGDDEPFEAAGDIDHLPDLEAYADSFESASSGSGADGGQSQGGYSSGSVEIDGEQEDPATVAKALRKFMKKDEEG
jgi:hypothetical protein